MRGISFAVVLQNVSDEPYLQLNFVKTIRTLGEGCGMQFPLIYLESCRSALGDRAVAQLRVRENNIGRLYTSDIRGLKYQTLNYERMFQQVRRGKNLGEALNEELLTVYKDQKADREKELDPAAPHKSPKSNTP